MRLGSPAALLGLLVSAALPAQGKNVLFYGNSFSFFNGGVAQIVRAIAIEAGQPAPTCVERLFAGQDLHYHATDPAQIAAISNSLPPGQTWDFVVEQGISTEATVALGHPAQFVQDAITILGNVRSHSPAAQAVMFQTWARGQGHSYYPTTFASPLAMHLEVRGNYHLAVSTLQSTYGPGAARLAAAGDCAALLQFDPSIYFTDLQHPANALTVMTAMCLFSSIYSRSIGDLVPNYPAHTALASLMTNYGFTTADWRRLAGIADTCADRSQRRYPGSGELLLLESGTQNGTQGVAPTAFAVKPVSAGTLVTLRVSSRNGVYDGAGAWLLADLMPTGSPPTPLAAYPELAPAPATLAVLAGAPGLASPLVYSVPIPISAPGISILVQGLAWQASGAMGNPWFTTTDAHELVLQ